MQPSPAVMNNETDDTVLIVVPFAYEVVQAVFGIIALLLLLIGNSVVVITLASNRKLLYPMNIYIKSISVSGVICALLIPISLGYHSSPFLPYTISCFARKIVGIIFFTTNLNSVFCMLVIATERYHVIVQQKSSPVEDKYRFLIAVGIWLCAFLYNAPLYFGDMAEVKIHYVRTTTSSENLHYNYCIPTGPIARIHFTVSAVVAYLLPVFLMAYMYQKTISVVTTQMKKFNVNFNPQHKAKLRAVKMMISIVIIFVLCWLPGRCLQIISVWYTPDDGKPRFSFKFIVLHDVAIHTGLAHHWIHTIVYPVQCLQFRRKMGEIFASLSLWGRKRHQVRNSLKVEENKY